MSRKDAKNCAKILDEVKGDLQETCNSAGGCVSSVADEARDLKKLWREKNKSSLVKAGVALIILPVPIVSDVAGTGLVAAGLLQQRIRNSGLFLEDIVKNYPRLFKELQQARQSLE